MIRACTILFYLLICSCSVAQKPAAWYIEPGIHLSADAELVYLFPSIMLGGGLQLGERVDVSASYTFFYARIKGPETFRTHTIQIVPHFYFQNVFDPTKGLYLGLGAAWQNRKQTPEELMVSDPSYWAGVFNIGYRFPLAVNKKKRMAKIDLQAIGPYIDKEEDYVEGITQLMLGIKLRF